jgi:hypothetical protein
MTPEKMIIGKNCANHPNIGRCLISTSKVPADLHFGEVAKPPIASATAGCSIWLASY